MPLTGEAKKKYQREYMRDYQRQRRAGKKPAPKAANRDKEKIKELKAEIVLLNMINREQALLIGDLQDALGKVTGCDPSEARQRLFHAAPLSEQKKRGEEHRRIVDEVRRALSAAKRQS